ncbi:hypothetical protein [uncultured Fibrella sp.]|uniref:hypothetical protein n=1 Tax=uncultured Fibrella sp. TaxID=1284596 RepID=UPI0035CBC8F5
MKYEGFFNTVDYSLTHNVLLMYTEYKVSFTESIPSYEKVVDELQLLTGLELNIDSKTKEIFNPFDDSDTVNILPPVYTNEYIIMAFYGDMNYLLCAAIYTLTKLGGKYDLHLPKWSSKSWKEYKRDSSW